MNSKELKNIWEAYNTVYEQTGVKVPSGASDTEALKGLIPKGDKVHEVPKKKSTLQNASYEPEGEQLSENPLASLDKIAGNTVRTVGGMIGKNRGQKTGIPGGGTVGEIIGRNKADTLYNKAKQTVGGVLNQSYDPEGELVEDQETNEIFNYLLEYLVAEGYADTNQAALVIMANMSEEWKQNIVEVLGGQPGDGYIGHPRLGIKNSSAPPKKSTNIAPKNTGLAGKLGNRASELEDAINKLR